MPIYEYKCNKCGNTFEQLVFPSDDDKFKCPSCGKNDTSRLLSSFSCGSGDSIGDISSSLSSGCAPSGGFS